MEEKLSPPAALSPALLPCCSNPDCDIEDGRPYHPSEDDQGFCPECIEQGELEQYSPGHGSSDSSDVESEGSDDEVAQVEDSDGLETIQFGAEAQVQLQAALDNAQADHDKPSQPTPEPEPSAMQR